MSYALSLELTRFTEIYNMLNYFLFAYDCMTQSSELDSVGYVFFQILEFLLAKTTKTIMIS